MAVSNPLHKLRPVADAAALKMSKVLRSAQGQIRAAISDAAAAGHVAGSSAARDALYKIVRDDYASAADTIDKSLATLATKSGRAAVKAAKEMIPPDSGRLVKFDQKRLNAEWEYINKANGSSLAAVFTDKMGADAITRLREAFLSVYRNAAANSWTANETQKRMRNAWDAVAGDADTYRFIDKAGRHWENADYLRMLHRTTAMRIERDYTADRMAAAGCQTFRIAGGSADECEICRAWDGAIICMERKKGSNLPTYAEAVDAGVFHPNCQHYLQPVDENWGDDAKDIARQENRGYAESRRG